MCKGNCLNNCNCPVAIDWNKPLQIKNVPSLILISACIHPNNKLLRIVTAINKDAYATTGSGFTYLVCSETGKHMNKDYNIINIPTPKKKVKVFTVLFPNMSVVTTSEARFKENPNSYRTCKILKTEEFEYDE